MKRVSFYLGLVIVLLANFSQLRSSSLSSPCDLPVTPTNTPTNQAWWAGAGASGPVPDVTITFSWQDYADLCHNANQAGLFFSVEPGTPRTVLKRVVKIIESGSKTPTSSPDLDPTYLFPHGFASGAGAPVVTKHTSGQTDYLTGSGRSSPASPHESVHSTASSATWYGMPAAISRRCVIGVGVGCLAAGVILGKILEKKK